jgi:hypothetical protein
MRLDWFEIAIISICLLFVTAISLYHISYPGYLKLTEAQWATVWAVAENGFCLTLCFLVSQLTGGGLKLLFKWLLIPYFVLKLVYYFSCYSGVHLFTVQLWEYIWSFVLVFMIIGGLIICLNLTRKRNVDQVME